MTDEKMGELLALLEKALEVDPNDFECHRMQAEVYLSMHDFENSKASGQKATNMNPNDPRVISVYGEALLRLGDVDRGIDYLEKAYELDPVPQGQTTGDRRLAALFLGYYLKNNFDKCNEINEKIVNIDNRTWLLNVDIHKNFSKDYEEANWFKKGLNEFKSLDWPLEVDRYHLNNEEKTNSLIELAENV
jgi:Tfp pilus assembly protein PilF